MSHKIKNLVVDTTAFINNAPLQEIAENIYTVQEVVDEIVNKRQLRRLIVLPYDLVIKDVFPENITAVTEFSKKTGDYPSLSATDIKVMALTYQLEKEKVGTSHLKTEPAKWKTIVFDSHKPKDDKQVSGFFVPKQSENGETNKKIDLVELDKNLNEKFSALNCDIDRTESEQMDGILATVTNEDETTEDKNVDSILATVTNEDESDEIESSDDDDDETGWISLKNLQKAKKSMDEDLVEDKPAVVACITTDFAMQNVLKQMNLQIAALDGRVIKQLRTFILRCYTCFKTTSRMEKEFCPKCGNKTLKKVAVSVDAEGKQTIHINARRPLTSRGKKFSLPTFKGGKHANNPVISEDQPRPEQRPTRQAKMKNNPLDPDYTAGFSPFVMRDVNSRSALLGIRPGVEVKHWMKKNPNEPRRRKK